MSEIVRVSTQHHIQFSQMTWMHKERTGEGALQLAGEGGGGVGAGG